MWCLGWIITEQELFKALKATSNAEFPGFTEEFYSFLEGHKRYSPKQHQHSFPSRGVVYHPKTWRHINMYGGRKYGGVSMPTLEIQNKSVNIVIIINNNNKALFYIGFKNIRAWVQRILDRP